MVWVFVVIVHHDYHNYNCDQCGDCVYNCVNCGNCVDNCDNCGNYDSLFTIMGTRIIVNGYTQLFSQL